MSRVKENREILKQLDPLLRTIGDIDNVIRNYLLIDISKSLALIADNLEEQTKWFQDFEEENNAKHGEEKDAHGND